MRLTNFFAVALAAVASVHGTESSDDFPQITIPPAPRSSAYKSSLPGAKTFIKGPVPSAPRHFRLVRKFSNQNHNTGIANVIDESTESDLAYQTLLRDQFDSFDGEYQRIAPKVPMAPTHKRHGGLDGFDGEYQRIAPKVPSAPTHKRRGSLDGFDSKYQRYVPEVPEAPTHKHNFGFEGFDNQYQVISPEEQHGPTNVYAHVDFEPFEASYQGVAPQKALSQKM